jgi:outer membrane protein OmpA-like peptidoglycan-associated protein
LADKAKRDQHNNSVFEPSQSKPLEGRRTHLVYLLPENVSPLQAVRNYQNAVVGLGGKTLFECKSPECGGDPGRSSEGGGGDQSLPMTLWPEANIKDKHFSNGHCAQTMRTSEQRYAALELPKSNSFVSVLAYSGKDDLYCKAFNNRTIVVADVLEVKAMQQKMVTVKAEEMSQAINANGRVALYGLYFDTAKADVKPESRDTLEQIAKLLAGAPALRLLVVGHTDNVGEFGANTDLSKRRADAVVAALAGQYKVERKRLTPVGVSFASPVAANTSEEGRAKNRRVELVPNN